jgi:hypothetical protein
MGIFQNHLLFSGFERCKGNIKDCIQQYKSLKYIISALPEKNPGKISIQFLAFGYNDVF